MELLPALYAAVYAVSLGSVLAIVFVVLSLAHRTGTVLGGGRLAELAMHEVRRLGKLEPVLLMHVSIALGVALSMVVSVLDPLFFLLPALRTILLIVSIPLVGGLVAAFVWRLQRYVRSKRVERELLHKSESFSRASSALQLVLVLAIVLTTGELLLSWFPALAIVDEGLDVARNALVIAYYTKPSVNLLRSFERPLWAMRSPFKLVELIEGTVDPSQVRIGAGQLSEFEDFERQSYGSCVEIGACEAACPATAAGRQLSPRVLVRSLSLLERRNGLGADPMTSVTENELWSCTSCGACVHACPVAVKHLDLIYDLRRSLVNAGRLDREKAAILQNLVQSQNPFGFDSRTRGDWAKSRDDGVDISLADGGERDFVQTVSTNPEAEYLYWVGCVASFDQRAQIVARSLAKILRSAGVSFAILGSEEACIGDPARRLGEEGRYQELAYRNIEKMNAYGVKKVITTCPHCFNALKNEYPLFGGSYEVLHHTQIISDLIRQGRIKLAPDKVEQISVTLHDACYAARYNNIFDEPREVLRATGVEMHEMHRAKENTFCCGAGGSNYWFKVPQQESMAAIRTEEAVHSGARRIATECPFCLAMLADSSKVSGAEMDVRDVAEIVADSLAK